MSNVVSFSKKKQESSQAVAPANSSQAAPVSQGSVDSSGLGLSFEEISRRNLENSERIRREREKANKNVLRSYRIK